MVFNILPKEVFNEDGLLIGTATAVMLRVLPVVADKNNIVPGYYEYHDANGLIHRDARGNQAIDLTAWESDRDSVYSAFLDLLEVTVI